MTIPESWNGNVRKFPKLHEIFTHSKVSADKSKTHYPPSFKIFLLRKTFWRLIPEFTLHIKSHYIITCHFYEILGVIYTIKNTISKWCHEIMSTWFWSFSFSILSPPTDMIQCYKQLTIRQQTASHPYVMIATKAIHHPARSLHRDHFCCEDSIFSSVSFNLYQGNNLKSVLNKVAASIEFHNYCRPLCMSLTHDQNNWMSQTI